MIRYAKPPVFTMRSLIKALYQTIFGDSDSYTQCFFDTIFNEALCYLAYDGDDPVAMMLALPADLSMPGEQMMPVAYYYAIGTLPGYRGRGIATRLMDFADRDQFMQGIPLSILRPAEPSLFDFYARRGYTTPFHVREVSPSPRELSGIRPDKLTEVDADVFMLAREAAFRGAPYIFHWGEIDLHASVLLHRLGGGQLLSFSDDACQGYAICYNREGTVHVSELICPVGEEARFARSLLYHYRANAITLWMPADSAHFYGEGQVIPFAMARGTAEEVDAADIFRDAGPGAYMNITLE